MPHSVVFIGNSEYEKFDYYNKPNIFQRCLAHISLTLCDLPNRIITSFVPPIFGERSRMVYVDFVGPSVALIILCSLLGYGHKNKDPDAAVSLSPFIALLNYCIFMPFSCYFITKLGNATLSLMELVGLLGYGLYGHIITIILSCLFDNEYTNIFFYIALATFSGLGGLRIVIILLVTIPKPIARLLVCSLITVTHLLFLIFIYFTYMHRTFVYGRNLQSDEYD